jgi:predicted short-subunit dehydrogenase-like oxidoreductase (DUF2520 family)
MKVVLIGSGNVATILAKLLYNNGYSIAQVYSSSLTNAKQLAQAVNAQAVESITAITLHADIYIIAVSDKAIASVASTLQLGNKLVLHTAGSVSIDVLKNVSSKFGVLYPVQSVRKNMDLQTPIPFLVDGNTETVLQEMETIAQSLNQKVVRGNDEARVKLHLAAVFACNFVNYMYLQSANFCKAEKIDFSLLQPLIEETANRLHTYHPSEVFTGPAVRGDMATIEKHLALLSAYPLQQQLYKTISDLILEERKK